MPKRKALYYIAFMLLLTALLMVVSNNVPILASYRWVWAPLFLIFSLFFYTNAYLQKPVITSLIYGILFSGLLQYTLWNYANDWYKLMILEDFYSIVVPVVLFTILKQNGYWNMWSRLARYGVVFIAITGIMTFIATNIDPMVIRYSYSSYEIKNSDFLYRLGFGSYGYMTAIVALLPILVYFFKQTNNPWLSKRVLVILIVFFYILLIKAQIFANILVGAGVLLFSALGAKRLNKSIAFLLITSVFLIAIPSSFYVNVLNAVADSVDHESLVHEKFSDMALYVEDPILAEDDVSTDAGSRASRYPALWKAFIASPWFGDASYNSPYDNELATGGHLYWMSRLALWGMFGFLGYLFILRNIFKPVLRLFDDEFRFYYYLSLFSTIVLGLLKNLGGREPYFMLLIIIPGLYFLSKVRQHTY